mgnify:CR=1 FL=1
MTVAKKSRGRPGKSATAERMVAFRADEEVLAALAFLEVRVVGAASSKGRRSFAIRRAILEAAERAKKDVES